jgi:hypothetical protein
MQIKPAFIVVQQEQEKPQRREHRRHALPEERRIAFDERRLRVPEDSRAMTHVVDELGETS